MRGPVGLLAGVLLVMTACGQTERPAADEVTSTPADAAAPTSPPSSAAAEPQASASATPEDPTSTRPQSSPESRRPERRVRNRTAIKVSGSEFGPMLFDRSGQAIYLFDRETTARPRCYGQCAAAWPPVLTDGRPRALDGVREGLLGTTRRRNGARQVTYAGHPLYFYAHEGKNEVLCHNVSGSGGLWLVVTPAGRPAP